MRDLIVESAVFGFLVVFVGILIGWLSPTYFKPKLSSDAKETYELHVVELTLFVASAVGYGIYKHFKIGDRVKSMF